MEVIENITALVAYYSAVKEIEEGKIMRKLQAVNTCKEGYPEGGHAGPRTSRELGNR